MHIETFKIFCDIAELSSFSKTADRNFISQSAVSQQLAQLELLYNCQLINRKKRPIELTNEGQLLYKAAKEIYDRYDKIKVAIKDQKTTLQSRVNVGAIFSIGMHSLPDYIKAFMVRYPKVNVHIEYLNAQRIYELVLNGELDIGIVAIPQNDKRLDVYDFKNENLVFVCNPHHPLANYEKIDIHKLQFERYIAFESGVPTRIWIDAIFNKYKVILRPIMEFDNIETIKRAIEINAGISVLPEKTIQTELKNGSLKCLNFTNEDFVRPTGIIVAKDKLKSKYSKEFVSLLRKNKI
ncbi:MAG: LysR family transcriptional regulator [Phycisphaerae bacterium]|nr:LysR family transcriptional regulator [Phycisphaerae bacterium]